MVLDWSPLVARGGRGRRGRHSGGDGHRSVEADRHRRPRPEAEPAGREDQAVGRGLAPRTRHRRRQGWPRRAQDLGHRVVERQRDGAVGGCCGAPRSRVGQGDRLTAGGGFEPREGARSRREALPGPRRDLHPEGPADALVHLQVDDPGRRCQMDDSGAAARRRIGDCAHRGVETHRHPAGARSHGDGRGGRRRRRTHRGGGGDRPSEEPSQPARRGDGGPHLDGLALGDAANRHVPAVGLAQDEGTASAGGADRAEPAPEAGRAHSEQGLACRPQRDAGPAEREHERDRHPDEHHQAEPGDRHPGPERKAVTPAGARARRGGASLCRGIWSLLRRRTAHPSKRKPWRRALEARWRDRPPGVGDHFWSSRRRPLRDAPLRDVVDVVLDAVQEVDGEAPTVKVDP